MEDEKENPILYIDLEDIEKSKGSESWQRKRFFDEDVRQLLSQGKKLNQDVEKMLRLNPSQVRKKNVLMILSLAIAPLISYILFQKK